MVQLLKVSTAYTFRMGPFVDSTDGVSAETGLTLSQADFRLSKAGGAFAQKNESTSGSHDENGYYTCILNTTDTNTVGTLDINVSESGALPVFKSFMVVPANIYDSLVAGSDLIDVSVVQNAGTNITSASGRQEVNVSHYGGTAGTFSAGRPEVNTTHAAGTAWGSGAITAAAIASNAITSAKVATDAIGAAQLATDAVTEIWNGNPNLIRTNTAQGGTSNSITLDASASATNGLYDPSLIVITGGTGVGQARLVTDYNGTSKVAIVNRDWRTTPDNTSVYRLLAAPNMTSLNEGLAQAGGASTITLNALASATDNVYNGQCVWITTGTGQDQLRLITGYVGSTKVATVGEAWVTQPTSSSGYMILPHGRSLVVAMNTDTITSGAVASSAVTEIQSGLATSSSISALNNLSAAQVTAAVPTANANADALLDRTAGVETGLTVRQWLRLAASVLFGKASGLDTTTAVYRDFGDTKDRISATVTADGNRTAVTRDAT